MCHSPRQNQKRRKPRWLIHTTGLWKLMIDKKINKTTLRREAGITSNAMAKMGKDEPVAEDPNIIYDPVCVCSKNLFRCKKCSMPATGHGKGVCRQQE